MVPEFTGTLLATRVSTRFYELKECRYGNFRKDTRKLHPNTHQAQSETPCQHLSGDPPWCPSILGSGAFAELPEPAPKSEVFPLRYEDPQPDQGTRNPN